MPITLLDVRHESWPLAEAFVISRGAKTAADVVVATVTDGKHIGRGEAVPYARYGETVQGVVDEIRCAGRELAGRAALQHQLPPGAARNAIDCALWDLEARSGRIAPPLAALVSAEPILTCYTLSLGTPEAMAAKARSVPHLPLLKLKLGGAGDAERMKAVRAARPDARLVADANEAWTEDMLEPLLAVAAEAGFELIEQPLPAERDGALADIARPVPVCADESLHTRNDLAGLRHRYDAVNIKLDKAGGLTEALATVAAAREMGLSIMVGCMVATSLAMAPALVVANGADWVDLDGPLLLAKDREPGLGIVNGFIQTPPQGLWG